MKFTYEPVSYGGYILLEPRAPVVFTNPANGKSRTIKALVDSGAARTVLHPSLADFLGVDLDALETLPISSANHDSTGYAWDDEHVGCGRGKSQENRVSFLFC